MRIARAGWLLLSALLLGALLLSEGAGAEPLLGVNLAGAAYSSNKIPGLYGRDFVYPKSDEISYFARQGMNTVRLSILWERLQPSRSGALDPAELRRLQGFIASADRAGMSTIIDIHDYGRYRGVPIGQAPVTAADFADLWRRVAEIFKSDPHVLFGLMNEPQQRDAGAWVGVEQLAVDAIRRTGARNLILASGIGWDGAHDFATVNGAAFGHLHDPARQIVVEVHQYFDRDSSGTHDDCTSPDGAVARLAGFTTWARAAHRQAVLGEFGVSRKPECLAVLNGVMSFLADNGDVWRGWTYWAAGPLWGNYMFTLEPDHGSDRPQMRVLAPFLRRVGVPPAPSPRSP